MTKQLEFHPFAEEYPLMPAYELGRMEEDMRERGYDPRFPIVLYQKQILDGRNRQLASNNAGVKPMYVTFEGTEDEARLFVQRANEERRHLAQDWLQRRREERRARAQQARAEGKSIRAIAEQEGVDAATVHRDLKKAETASQSSELAENPSSGVAGATPEQEPCQTPAETKPAPQSVTGRDGKKYKATKPKGQKPTEESEPEALKDEIDHEVPPGLVTVFEKAKDFKEIVNQLNGINRKLIDLKQHPAGAMLRLQAAQIDLKNLKETVRFDTPYCVCPVCSGMPRERKKNCPCKDRGWLNETSYKNLPSEYRQ